MVKRRVITTFYTFCLCFNFSKTKRPEKSRTYSLDKINFLKKLNTKKNHYLKLTIYILVDSGGYI